MIAPARLAAYDVLRAVSAGRSDLPAALARVRVPTTHAAIHSGPSTGNEIIVLSEEEKGRWRNAVRPVYDAWIAEMTRRGRNGRAMFDDIQAISQRAGRS